MTNTYHFSLGNSTKSQIGYCARVEADTKQGAVERLRNLLDEAVPSNELEVRSDRGEYIAVYFNPDTLRASHIDEWRSLEDDDGNVT